MSVIRIAAGVPPGEMQDTDLDLFDTRVSNVVRDKRFTARFWNRVQRMTEVFGLIGGRSGSLDVAAFVGMNCFEWDEPVFNIAVGALDIELKHLPSKEYTELQVPQYLRLLNQCFVINIGLLDASSYDYKHKIFTRLEIEELDRWLSGELDVYPL
ncbi:putative Chitinase [Seiridium cardinale]